jgi:hypothetical protein
MVAVSVVAPSAASSTQCRQISRSPRRSPPDLTAAGRPHTEHTTDVPARRRGVITLLVAFVSNTGAAPLTDSNVA